jgi:hypothetical protein
MSKFKRRRRHSQKAPAWQCSMCRENEHTRCIDRVRMQAHLSGSICECACLKQQKELPRVTVRGRWPVTA